MRQLHLVHSRRHTRPSSSEDVSQSQAPSRTESPVLVTPSGSVDVGNMSEMDVSELVGTGDRPGLDPIQEHYVSVYSIAELKTFHCERVRKMPLSGLDPSMLLGFLCKNEADWIDFRRRAGEVSVGPSSISCSSSSWHADTDVFTLYLFPLNYCAILVGTAASSANILNTG